jgi:ABC-type polysaccharide/polyol phosphate export permease
MHPRGQACWQLADRPNASLNPVEWEPVREARMAKLVGWVAILLGAAALVGSLLADRIGLGGVPGVFGWKQSAGAVFGAILIAIGIAGLIRGRARGHPVDSSADKGKTVGRLEGFRGANYPIYDSAALRIPFLSEITELYRYRFLLYNLVSRDLKVRYKRSFLGFLWAMVNPLLTMIVLLVVFTRLYRFSQQNLPVYILAGLLLWNFFSRGTSVAMRSMIDSSPIRSKVYVPASVFVAASIGSALVNLLLALGPVLLLSMATGARPTPTWLYLPVPILQTGILAFGVGLIIAAIAVFFADMTDIYEVLLAAFFYLTPIFYPISILPERLQSLEKYNLLYVFIQGFRISLLEAQIPSLVQIVLPTLAALVVTLIGWSLFTRLMDQFAYHA